MMTDADRKAVALYPELQRLIELRGLGWIFGLTFSAGSIVVKGMYLYRDGMVHWADILQIRDRTDCAAVRLTPDRELVWERTGTLVDIVDGLAQLPHPTSPLAPRLVLGKADKLLWA